LLHQLPLVATWVKFNEVLDRLLLEFVHTKLDLYKKLTEPKVNEMLKRQWFEVLASDANNHVLQAHGK
jgi:type I restriction enzyme R subunit